MLDAQGNDLLRGLSAVELQRVLPLFERREFGAGQVILRWSDPGDRLYVIDSGRVSVVVPEKSGAETIIAQLGPGQVFGEMAMLTGQPRTADVRSVVHTVVYAISYTAFFGVAGHSPILLLNIGRVLAGRLARMLRSSTQEERHALVVLLGTVSPQAGSLVATNLAAALAATAGRRAMLVDIPGQGAARLPGREWAPDLDEIRNGEQTLAHLSQLQVGPVSMHVVSLPERDWSTDRAAAEQASRSIARLGRVAEFVVVNLVGPPNPLIERVLPLANRIYVVTPGASIGSPELAELTRRCRQLMAPRTSLDMIALSDDAAPTVVRQRARAILGVTQCGVLPAEHDLLRSAAGLPAPFALRAPHLEFSREIHRLARAVAGLRVGLALGSGAAKGVAHVGVVKALHRLGVPIDAVAGTSIGALVGAGVAIGMDLDEMEETMRSLVELWGDALKPVIPRFSLVGSGGLDRIVKRLTGEARCEALPTPYGAVATDLNSGRSLYLCQGPLAQAVRSSISIPLVFPPVQIGEYTLVDGFVTNPVPTQLVRLLGADIVIGSTPHARADTVDQQPLEYREPLPEPTRRGSTPNILETYMRCAELMTAGRSETDLLSADVVLRANVPDISWKDFQKGESTIRAGEQAVEAEVERLREVLPWLRPAG